MRNLTASSREKIQALQANSYFRGLDECILEELVQGTALRRYERGEGVCWEGDPCAGLFIVQRGSVKLYKTSHQGRELIIRILEEGATFNEVPVFDLGANPVNVATLEECDLWWVDAQSIRDAMLAHPKMSHEVILNLTANLRNLVSMVEELSFYQVTNRLARLISQLSEEQLVGQASQRLTQDQIAARLGSVREVVARSLRTLERSGAIRVRRRQIEVIDLALLQEWIYSPANS